MAEERSKRLQERFSTHNKKAESKQSTKNVDRGRHSLYLDKALVGLLDNAYKVAAHDLYPLEIDKATFLEECLKYALQHQSDIQTSLSAQLSPKTD